MSVDLDTQVPDGGRGWKFWLIIIALCISEFLSALDLVCIFTLSVVSMLNSTDT